MNGVLTLARKYLAASRDINANFREYQQYWDQIRKIAAGDSPDPYDLVMAFGSAVRNNEGYESIMKAQTALFDYYDKHKETELPSTIGKLPPGIKRVA
jgi:hypothetical protein